MAYYSIASYPGDGVTDIFSVPFPYLSKDHVIITVNDITAVVRWITDNSIRIIPIPAEGAVVNIQRQTKRDTRIVDFQNGGTLREYDLDTSALQNFYIAQETLDLWTAVVEPALIKFAQGNGVVNVTPANLADQIVADVLTSALYTDLQTRIEDVDLNGETLLASELRDERLFTSVANASALVHNEQIVRAAQDSALASQITTVQTTVDGFSATIEEQVTSIDGLSAQYTVKIDNNGYVSGFGLASYPADDGTHTSTFTILADQFAVVMPGEASKTPFVVGNIGGVTAVGVDGQLIVDGTIYAQSIAAGTIGADKITVNTLSALSADLGTVTSGLFKTSSGTGYRVEIDSAGTLPLWYGNGSKSTGTAKFYVDSSGNAVFAGNLSAAGGTFVGNLTAAGGTFAGTLTASAINAVDTINLAGQAVTIPVSTYSSGSTGLVNGAYTSVQSATILSTGAPIVILGSAAGHFESSSGSTQAYGYQISRNGTVILDTGALFDNFGIFSKTGEGICVAVVDTPGAGYATYQLLVYTSGWGTAYCTNRSLVLLETKR